MIHPKKQVVASTPDSDIIHANFSNPYLELIRLLTEAAGIEHLLMLQYLYAAFSINDKYPDVRGTMVWKHYIVDNTNKETSLFRVAIEEMQHLRMVNEFLSALGAAPNLLCEDPANVSDIYPFTLKLESLTRDSTAIYAYVEADKTAFSINTSSSREQRNYVALINSFIKKRGEPRQNHIGSLYASIIDCTRKVIADPPRFLTRQHIDWNKYHNNMMFIKDEGELAHYEFFKSVFMGTHKGFAINEGGAAQVWENNEHSGLFPSNRFDATQTTAYLGNGEKTIKDPTLRKIAWLSNLHYWLILALLDVNYRGSSMVPKYKAIGNMTEALYACGIILANNSIGVPFDTPNLNPSLGRNTGYSLEIIKLMLQEAQNEAYLIQKHLPGFNFTVYELTLNGLTEIESID